MSVMTVCGKVDADALGIVTPHEHIYIDMQVFFASSEEIGMKQLGESRVTMETLGYLKRNPFLVRDNVVMEDPGTQTRELMYFKYAGGKTVVDATTIGLGRDVQLLRRMAVDTDLNVIAGAGYYVEPAQSEEVLSFTIEELKNRIVDELTVGIGHTDIRAGVIGEVGISHHMLPFEEKNLRASCRAQKETGAPLLVHINPWSTEGIAAMKVIREEKVDLKRVMICHIDVENRDQYISELLETGVFVEFDNFGKEMYMDHWDIKEGSGRFVTDIDRVRLVKNLLDRGYGRQIMLSCDVCLKSLLHQYGGWGYDHILTHIIPMLKEEGVQQDQIDTMLKDNPKVWLDYDC
jgi:phosphotriesterase-related protein